jgi:hypothetical protein
MDSFWDKWGGLIQRLFASVGSQASLVALALVFAPQPVTLGGWPLVLIGVATVLAVLSVWLEFASEMKVHKHRKTYRRDDANGIKEYMQRWIGQSGRAAIWTRDLSWVDDDKTKQLLETKAESGNLDVYTPALNEFGKRLRAAGAKVHLYGGDAFPAPASRFTIAFSGNGGSRVAIAHAIGGMHVIEELDGAHPAFHLANDLCAVAKLLAGKGGADA